MALGYAGGVGSVARVRAMSSRGRSDHRSAIAYRDGRLIAIELDHDSYPEHAESWRARGDEVLVLSEREALERWDREVRHVI